MQPFVSHIKVIYIYIYCISHIQVAVGQWFKIKCYYVYEHVCICVGGKQIKGWNWTISAKSSVRNQNQEIKNNIKVNQKRLISSAHNPTSPNVSRKRQQNKLVNLNPNSHFLKLTLYINLTVVAVSTTTVVLLDLILMMGNSVQYYKTNYVICIT